MAVKVKQRHWLQDLGRKASPQKKTREGLEPPCKGIVLSNIQKMSACHFFFFGTANAFLLLGAPASFCLHYGNFWESSNLFITSDTRDQFFSLSFDQLILGGENFRYQGAIFLSVPFDQLILGGENFRYQGEIFLSAF